MKREKLLTAIIVGGSIGLIANPVWSHDSSSQQTTYERSGAQISPRADSEQKSRLLSMQIMEIQEALVNKGYDPGVVDGMMTAETQKAIRAFQTDEGLAVTGTIDERTANQLGVSVSSENWQSPSDQTKAGEDQNVPRAGEPHGGQFGQ